MPNENRIRSNSIRRLYQGLTDDQRVALVAALERVRIIEGTQNHGNNHDERLSGWFLQRTPNTGTPITLRLVKRDPQSNRITQVVQVCGGAEQSNSPRKTEDRNRAEAPPQ